MILSAPCACHLPPGTSSLAWGCPWQVHERTNTDIKIFPHLPDYITPANVPLSKRVLQLGSEVVGCVPPLRWEEVAECGYRV